MASSTLNMHLFCGFIFPCLYTIGFLCNFGIHKKRKIGSAHPCHSLLTDLFKGTFCNFTAWQCNSNLIFNIRSISDKYPFLFSFNRLKIIYLVVMSPSWNFLAWAEPSYEGSKPSPVELGHFNFRAETKLNQNFLTHFSPSS